MTDDQDARMQQMWADGASAKRIGQEFDVSAGYVNEYAMLNRDRFPYRRRRATDEERERALELVRNGATCKEAGEAVGVSGMSVCRWVHGR